jgi:hypothetical protein
MMIEGSGSGRPKNMWIRWIRIRKTVPEDELEAECLLLLHPVVELGDLLAGGLEAVLGRPQVPLPLRRLLARLPHLGCLVLVPGLAIKKPTLKNPQRNHLKKPLKMFFLGLFGFFKF